MKKEIKYFLVIWFIILTLNYFSTDILLLSYLGLFTGHVGFFILGYYLNKKDNKFTTSVWIGDLLFAAGTVFTFLSIYLPTLMSHQLDFTYLGLYNLSPGFTIKVMGIFIIMKNINYNKLFGNKSEKMNNFAMKFAEICYGLYLIHILVPIRMIYNVNITPFVNIPFLTLVIVVVTAILLLIMNRIPILQRFTGMPIRKKT